MISFLTLPLKLTPVKPSWILRSHAWLPNYQRTENRFFIPRPPKRTRDHFPTPKVIENESVQTIYETPCSQIYVAIFVGDLLLEDVNTTITFFHRVKVYTMFAILSSIFFNIFLLNRN